MDLAFSADDLAFRDEVRAFVAARLREEMRRAWVDSPNVLYGDRALTLGWQKILHERGWSVPMWPAEHGGPGWSATRRYIFDVEVAAAGAPPLPPTAVNMIGPVLMAYGTSEQQRRFLPPIVSADEYWCQGYSEPGAGSDLAALLTRAMRDGDHYVVDGSKIWTTAAHESDWMFCLVRTDASGRRQEGITFLLIDMTSPGITVRPLRFMSGGHEFNQVFLDGVRVPAANRVGREGQGWEIAKFLLEHERGGAFAAGRIRTHLDRLRRMAERACEDGRPLWADPGFRARYAALAARAEAAALTELRILDRVARGERPGPESSLVRLFRAELSQALTELTMETAGWHALPADAAGRANAEPVAPAWAVNAASRYFDHRANTIMGGTAEIQRGILARAVLGL